MQIEDPNNIFSLQKRLCSHHGLFYVFEKFHFYRATIWRQESILFSYTWGLIICYEKVFIGYVVYANLNLGQNAH